GQVQRVVYKGLIQQVAVHFAWGMNELQTVRPDQSWISVRTVHEFGAEAWTDVAQVGPEIGDPPDSQSLGLIAPHQDRECVFKAEGIQADHAIARLELLANLVKNDTRVGLDGVLEDGCQGRSGVFHIGIETTQPEGVVADKGSTEIEAAIDL